MKCYESEGATMNTCCHTHLAMELFSRHSWKRFAQYPYRRIELHQCSIYTHQHEVHFLRQWNAVSVHIGFKFPKAKVISAILILLSWTDFAPIVNATTRHLNVVCPFFSFAVGYIDTGALRIIFITLLFSSLSISGHFGLSSILLRMSMSVNLA